MATRLRFYQSLLRDPNLDDIEEWPDHHIRWLVEAFWMMVEGRVDYTKAVRKLMLRNKDALINIAEQRYYDKARRVLTRDAPALLSMVLPQVIIHIRAKKCKTQREYNDLLKEYDQSDAESDDEEEMDTVDDAEGGSNAENDDDEEINDEDEEEEEEEPLATYA